MNLEDLLKWQLDMSELKVLLNGRQVLLPKSFKISFSYLLKYN